MWCCTTACPAFTGRSRSPIKWCSPIESIGKLRSGNYSGMRQYSSHPARRSRRPVSDQHRPPCQRTSVRSTSTGSIRTPWLRRKWFFALAREAGVKFSPEIATCLYTALMTDTGSFMFQGTNENTFSLARELVLAGADPAHCALAAFTLRTPLGKIRLLGRGVCAVCNVEGHIGYVVGHAENRWSAAARSKRIAKDW
jgi:hypothetical protein